jgi:hypothetical protein
VGGYLSFDLSFLETSMLDARNNKIRIGIITSPEKLSS